MNKRVMRTFGLTAAVAGFVMFASSDAAAVSVKNFRELGAFYSAATGVPQTEAGVVKAYNNVKSRLPKNGTVDEFSSPAVMGALELGAAYCTAWLTAESAAPAASRRAHGPIDFLKTTKQVTDAEYVGVMKTYAKLFWLRDARPSEEASFAAAVAKQKTLAPDTAVGTKQVFLATCTQVATSLDALVVR